jgi:hypothetical protein
MWKIFAIICIPLTNPLGIMEEQCQVYYEIEKRVFLTEIECNVKAGDKAYEMVNGFAEMNVPFTRMQFGCELDQA